MTEQENYEREASEKYNAQENRLACLELAIEAFTQGAAADVVPTAKAYYEFVSGDKNEV